MHWLISIIASLVVAKFIAGLFFVAVVCFGGYYLLSSLGINLQPVIDFISTQFSTVINFITDFIK